MVDQYFQVGKIVNTQALRGELRVLASTDFPEERFQVGSELAIFKDKELLAQVEVDGHRLHKNFHLLHFKGYDSINDVEIFKGTQLKVHASQRQEELGENEFYYDEIVGLEVVTDQGQYLGKVREILALPANDVFAVQSPEPGHKDILIPYIADVVQNIDLESGQITIQLMEGLID
ncbi:ribosome maturation factor RimM [Aerococcus kribbianus]|uniref:Ribosome maturation factor RimM n=1 Tax=Aerococcus kribbianus TaxID=2999064 RepID=A0A9X3JD50_9LACT|nr:MULTISPECIES: ribosome maturation factor RimM [unclassified Aerococcus]MCZ0717140.1 ribosome maturation factor RimM [Aerococcus sp. YH-aer221]MCZ0725428.1 ribosome maturation factor RimM [Aerococcus sp. YH-aer222]